MGDEPSWEEEPKAQGADGRRPPPSGSAMVRIGGAGRGPGVIVVAVAIFVAIAFVKPWPEAGGPAFTPRPATPPPTERPSVDPLAGIRIDCQDPPGWRVFSRERWPGGTLRSWRTMTPATATSIPMDPATGVIPMSPEIEALGFCGPWAGPERPPDGVEIHAWFVTTDDSSGGPVRIASPLVLHSASPTLVPPLGALYAPPVVPGHVRTDLWAPGEYIFALQAGAYERMWAVRIPAPDAPAASTAGAPVP